MTDTVSAPPYGMTVWHVDPTAGVGAPAAGSFRSDSVSLPTTLAVDLEDTTGQAFDFAAVTVGDRLVLQQLRRATHYWAFDVAALTDHGTWWEIGTTTIGSDNGVFTTGQDYLFLFRHAIDDTVVGPPAQLVPADELDALVLAITVALQGEVQSDVDRDGAKVDRAVRGAILYAGRVVDIAVPPVFATAADVDPIVMGCLVSLAAIALKRPGPAYGLAGYEDADPSSRVALGAIRADLEYGLKQRWGVA
jgi:hypothetical protein